MQSLSGEGALDRAFRPVPIVETSDSVAADTPMNSAETAAPDEALDL